VGDSKSNLEPRAFWSRIKDTYIKQFNTGHWLHYFRINISRERFLDKLLSLIEVVVEYVFGMHIGYAVGWVTGLYVGHFYVERFEPVYLYDLSQLSYWRLAPYTFARNVAMIGVAAGMLIIAVINNKSLNKRLAS